MLPSAVLGGFRENGFPINTPNQVANVVLELVAGSHKIKENAAVVLGQGKLEDKCNGLNIYVEGGKAWEIEEGLYDTRDQWLGEGPNDRLMKASAWLASVSLRTLIVTQTMPYYHSGLNLTMAQHENATNSSTGCRLG